MTNVPPPIADYAYLSDCHGSALVSRHGSIDWCCLPRIDAAPCFARLLDWQQGGYCQVSPATSYRSSRRYLDGSLVLETTFVTAEGEVRVLDFLPIGDDEDAGFCRQVLRRIEGLQGTVNLSIDIVPRFDYGAIRPWIRRRGGSFIAVGGSDGLLINGSLPLQTPDRHGLHGSWKISSGEYQYLALYHARPEVLDDGVVTAPDADLIESRLAATVAWWQRWSDRASLACFDIDLVRRSATVLKGLTNAPTGAIAAAATTSLPEAPAGERNWDYRFSWIRDSYFTVRSLAELGFETEADSFRRFIERSTAGSSEELQILFGVGGERRLHEYTIDELEGYRHARPVRVGNAAEAQRQLDVYGELLDLAWLWHGRGKTPDDDYWEFLVELVDDAVELWKEPDQGMWEMRGAPRHFVLSKAMCWLAFDRGLRLAHETGRNAPVKRWEKARSAVREAIETKGYDHYRGVFIQAFEHPVMDASLLLLPIIGFVEDDDPRMVRTVDAICADLGEGGLLRRYAADADGLPGREGTFLACSFWLAECLGRQGRMEEARGVYQRAAATANDLGLLAEEYDITGERMMGNFPQGLSHLSQIAAAVVLAKGDTSCFTPSTPGTDAKQDT
ncbi:MAG TPA: glycoside hydrolase family 15 protein [Desulfuromonadales bacterium]|nr:glycoside hydrolase family 15 protein [Desulfuromonadales bacterium]